VLRKRTGNLVTGFAGGQRRKQRLLVSNLSAPCFKGRRRAAEESRRKLD
jgi:hypothetical protein